LGFAGEKAAEKTAEEPANSLLCYINLSYTFMMGSIYLERFPEKFRG
jgi:hypothetical protein